MSLRTRYSETFGVNAEHGLRNNLILLGATAILGIGTFAESSESAHPFEFLAVAAVAAAPSNNIGDILGKMQRDRN